MGWAEFSRPGSRENAAPLHPGRAAAALLALGMTLGGCSEIEKEKHALMHSVGAGFGDATREELSSDAKGTTVRMTVESRVPANWLAATGALSAKLAYHCRDGAGFSYVSQSPVGLDGGMEAFELEHPAGTLFEQVIRCSPPPPYEFALPAGTLREDALEQVRGMLQGEGDWDYGRFMVQAVAFHDKNPKYPAIASVLGSLIGERMRQCPQGFIINRIVVAAHPRPEETGQPSLHASYAVIGMETACQPSGTDNPAR